MKYILAAAALILVYACTAEPKPHSTPLPSANPILLQREKDKPEPLPSGTINDRLDRLQGQLEWAQHRIPKGNSK